jgi:AcrR family transcriptional regulator
MTERETEDTKQRLISTAGEVFSEHGFRAATVRDICTRAKANVAAVNYHFGDKEGLYLAAVEAAHCGPVELLKPEWTAGLSSAEELQFFIESLLQHLLDDRRPAWHARLMMREMAEPTQACVKLVEAYIRPLAEKLRGILKEILPPDVTDEERWLMGASIFGQCLFYKVHRPVVQLLMGEEAFARLDVKKLAGHIARFSLAAIAARADASAPARREGDRS